MKSILILLSFIFSSQSFATNLTCKQLFQSKNADGNYKVYAVNNPNRPNKKNYLFIDTIKKINDRELVMIMRDEYGEEITHREAYYYDHQGNCVVSEMYSPGYIWYVKENKKGYLEFNTKKDFSGAYRLYVKTNIDDLTPPAPPAGDDSCASFRLSFGTYTFKQYYKAKERNRKYKLVNDSYHQGHTDVYKISKAKYDGQFHITYISDLDNITGWRESLGRDVHLVGSEGKCKILDMNGEVFGPIAYGYIISEVLENKIILTSKKLGVWRLELTRKK